MATNRFTRPSTAGPGANSGSYQLQWNRRKSQGTTQYKPSAIVEWLTQIKASGVVVDDAEKELIDRILELGVAKSGLWYSQQSKAIQIIKKYRYKHGTSG